MSDLGYYYDLDMGYYTEKSRIYLVTTKDKRSWYSWEVVIKNKITGLGSTFVVADFIEGKWIGLSQEDKERALKRKAKL